MVHVTMGDAQRYAPQLHYPTMIYGVLEARNEV